MALPMSQDYNEAIQNPAASFADAELRQGEAVCNALGLPVPCSGNFADVYAVQCGPRKWAVKCFTRQIPGLQERYLQISQYLQQQKLPFMVEFQFQPQGIRVRGQWHPILKMEWVEGFALNAFVRDHLDKPQLLQGLAHIWLKLADRLREANLAHCDLQHGNVLLVAGGKEGKLGVRLVDYDGMCVPALEFLKSIEVGHPAYQHPQRLKEGTYGLQTDRFAELVIYTALRALAVGGKALWDRYDNGDNLLFKPTDLERPGSSALFGELSQSPDAEVRRLAAVLAAAASKPIEQVPLLKELVGGSQPVTNIQALPVARPAAAPVFAAASGGAAPLQRGKKPASKAGYYVATAVAFLLLLGGAAAFVLFGGSRMPAPVAAVGDPSKRETTERSPGPDTAPSVATKPQTRHELNPEPKKDPDPSPASPLTLDLGDGVKLELVRIKAGKFLMGSPDSDKDAADDEKPQHQVTISKDFYLAKYPVTQVQYARIMGKNPSWFCKDGKGADKVAAINTDQFPVEMVSWDEAQEFCKKVSELTKRRGELPTEAEWEYACRAGKTTRYYCGDSLTAKDANFNNTLGRTTKVGEYPANPWGLYDMAGNVWQWCADEGRRTYTKDKCTDPKETNGSVRVLRGGFWLSSTSNCRAACRLRGAPSIRNNSCGFRLLVRLD